MSHNTQASLTPLSSLAEWSIQRIRDVFETPSDELSRRAIDGTFSRTLKASLNGTALDFDGLCGLVSAMRHSAPNGLKVEWSQADDSPDDLGNRVSAALRKMAIRLLIFSTVEWLTGRGILHPRHLEEQSGLGATVRI
jgi:hypothetical protein